MNITQTFYDNLAAQYDKLFQDWEATTHEQALILNKIFVDSGFDRTARILDCACGIGTQAIGLAAMARKFKEARQMMKLTAVEAADRLGVSQAALSSWESGRKSPTIENLIGMADIYGVTTDYLLGRSNEPQGISDNRALTAKELRIRNGMPVWSER